MPSVDDTRDDQRVDSSDISRALLAHFNTKDDISPISSMVINAKNFDVLGSHSCCLALQG